MNNWSHWRGKARGAWSRGVDVRKTGRAVMLFGVVAALLLLYFLFSESLHARLRAPLLIVSVLGIVSALVSIQGALSLTRKHEHTQHMEGIVADLETLNSAMRAQRHDFKNHLQVLSALLEMEEYEEASEYIKKLNVNLRTLGKAMKTSLPALNALLLAKTSVCEQKRIVLELEVKTVLDELPIAPWQLCLLLANLIDNAIDAIAGEEMTGGRILAALTEDPFAYRIEVANNGPPIPERIRDKIFRPDVSTKGEGRGMGMSIVLGILDECDGEIEFKSDVESTVFRVRLPRAAGQAASAG